MPQTVTTASTQDEGPKRNGDADEPNAPASSSRGAPPTSSAASSLAGVFAALRTPSERRQEAEVDTIFAVLSQFPWFTSLNVLTQRSVAGLAHLAQFDPKMNLETEGELTTVFYVCLLGTMSVYRRGQSKHSRFIGSIGRGATVGEPLLDLVEVRSSSNVVAETQCMLIGIDRKQLNLGMQSAIVALMRPQKERSAEDVQSILQSIRAMTFFRQLTEDAQKTLASTAGHLHVKQGEAICRQGDKGNIMYVLLTGSIDVIVHDEHDKTTKSVGSLSAGDSFGELALIESSNRRNATCICESDDGADLITISKPVFEAVLNKADDLVYRWDVVRQSLSVPPNERSEYDVVVIMDMIKNKAFFRDMSDEVKSILAKVMETEVVETDQVVYEQCTRGDCLYVILSGECIEYKHIEGGTSSGFDASAVVAAAAAAAAAAMPCKSRARPIKQQQGTIISATTTTAAAAAAAVAPPEETTDDASSGTTGGTASGGKPVNRFRLATTQVIASKQREELHSMNTHIAQKMKKDAARASMTSGSNRRRSIAEAIGMKINETEQKAKNVLNILTRRKSSTVSSDPAALAASLQQPPNRTESNDTAGDTERDDATDSNKLPSAAGTSMATVPTAHARHGVPTGRFVSGDSFGESALSRPSSKRERTVVARCRTELLVIRRYTYDRLIQRTNNDAWSEHLAFLSSVPSLAGMRRHELLNLLYLLSPMRKEKGDLILAEGESVDSIYFVRRGTVTLTVLPALDSLGHDADVRAFANGGDAYGGEPDAWEGGPDEPQKHAGGGASFGRRPMLGSDVMPLVTLGPGDFFGEESVTRSTRRMRVGVSCSSPTELFVLSLADLARMPNSVRENIQQTAALRRAWRRTQRRMVMQMKSFRERMQHSMTVGGLVVAADRQASIVDRYYKLLNKRNSDAEERAADKASLLSSRFAYLEGGQGGLQHEMNVNRLDETIQRGFMAAGDERRRRGSDADDSTADGTAVRDVNKEAEARNNERVLTSSLLTDVVNNSWTFHQRGMSDIKRQRQRPSTAIPQCAPRCEGTDSALGVEKIDTAAHDDVDAARMPFDPDRDDLSSGSGAATRPRPMTAGAIPSVSRAPSAETMPSVPSYGIPTTPRSLRAGGFLQVKGTQQRPQTAISGRARLGQNSSTAVGGTSLYHGHRRLGSRQAQSARARSASSNASSNAHHHRPSSSSSLARGRARTGSAESTRNSIYQQRQHAISITNLEVTGRLFL